MSNVIEAQAGPVPVNHLAFTAENGVPFVVSFVPKGTRNPHYGFRESTDHNLVEFFDARYTSAQSPYWSSVGQFIGGYHAETIAVHHNRLDLNTGVPDWTIDHDNMAMVRVWVQAQQRIHA